MGLALSGAAVLVVALLPATLAPAAEVRVQEDATRETWTTDVHVDSVPAKAPLPVKKQKRAPSSRPSALPPPPSARQFHTATLDSSKFPRFLVTINRPGPPLVRLAWLLLRYSRSEELARKLLEWVALFAQVLAEQEGNEHLKTVLHYLLWIGDEAVHEATERVLDSVVDAQRAEELMRSYGEELMERGRQQGLARGREEGRLRGRAEALLQLLTARDVHVDDAARQLILSCSDVATLDLWFDRAIHATSLSEVLAPPSQ
jgi:hypothetical protein